VTQFIVLSRDRRSRRSSASDLPKARRWSTTRSPSLSRSTSSSRCTGSVLIHVRTRGTWKQRLLLLTSGSATASRLHWPRGGCSLQATRRLIHGGSVEDSSFMLARFSSLSLNEYALSPGHARPRTVLEFDRLETNYARNFEDLIPVGGALEDRARDLGGASMGAARRCGPRPRARARGGRGVHHGRPMSRRPPTRPGGRPIGPRRGRDIRGVPRRQYQAPDGGRRARRLKSRPSVYAEVTGRLRRHSVASLLALLDETMRRTTGSRTAGAFGVRCR